MTNGDYIPGGNGAPPESAGAAFYHAYAQRLRRIVSAQVHTARENVEDACHFAWAQYLSHADEIHADAAESWLSKTAVRQAWKLDRRERRELSLEAAAEEVGELPIPSRLPGPHERLDLREQLSQLSGLSERQQRLVWLRAAGLSYVEMAAYTGDSVRTVERQVLRATDRMRDFHEGGINRELEPERTAAPAGPSRPDDRLRALDERGLER